jgi:RHS repeat-associated protein
VNGAAATVTKYYSLGAQRVAIRKGSTLYYELADHLGSASVTTDSSGNNMTRQNYYPFGALRPGPGNNLPVDETYLGKTLDAATGLVQMGARYYDPAIGRFTAPDPIAHPDEPQSLNPYAYAHNNPLTLSDPTGRDVTGMGAIAGYCGMKPWDCPAEWRPPPGRYTGIPVDATVGPPSDHRIGPFHGDRCGGCHISRKKAAQLIQQDATHGAGRGTWNACTVTHTMSAMDCRAAAGIGWESRSALDIFVAFLMLVPGAAEADATEEAAAPVIEGLLGRAATGMEPGVVSATSKAAAREGLAGLDSTSAQFAAANRAIARATSSSTIDVVQRGGDVVVRVARPGADGHQVIETVVTSDGTKRVVQLAYDSNGQLVHYDPKTP